MFRFVVLLSGIFNLYYLFQGEIFTLYSVTILIVIVIKKLICIGLNQLFKTEILKVVLYVLSLADRNK